jgi:hypothetical protein
VTSNGVRASLEASLGGVPLESLLLLAVKPQFTVKLPQRRRTRRTVLIRPPAYDNLPDREYAPVIMDHLVAHGVRMR